ncbi:MAG: PAS domain S-box protein, partial [Candidatus Sericytochromatia bacterium]|nr:PAS domain S-box protein [Candidatus Sericytochromatia bacterium]
MIPADLPKNETERLKALYKYNILDTSPEKDLDSLTKLAAYICKTPIALITLVDESRQWFKSVVGLDAKQTPREMSFCAYSILQNDIFIVSNALQDQRFFDNPMVTEDPSIRAYAGVPLESPDGYKLGTLCVLDRVERNFSTEQKQALKDLSSQVMLILKLRLNDQLLKEAKNKLYHEKNNILSLIENNDGAIWSVDKDLRIISFNTGFKKHFFHILNFYPEIGMNLNDHIDWTLPKFKLWQEYYQRALNGEKFIIEDEFNVKEQKIYNETVFCPLINNDEIKGVTVFYKDTTKQKSDEIKIKESEERFRKFSEISFEGIAISENGKIIDINNSITNMLGYTKEEMLSLSRTSFVTEEYKSLVYKNSTSGYEEPYQVVAVKKDKSTFYAEIIGRQIQYNGKTIRVTS